jgi:hypothetical protein
VAYHQQTETTGQLERAPVPQLAGLLIVLLDFTVIPARSQDTVNEFWPEVVDQDSDQERSQFGPNFHITLKPILRMKFWTLNPENRQGTFSVS